MPLVCSNCYQLAWVREDRGWVQGTPVKFPHHCRIIQSINACIQSSQEYGFRKPHCDFFILVRRDESTGELRGFTVDLINAGKLKLDAYKFMEKAQTGLLITKVTFSLQSCSIKKKVTIE